MGGVEFTAGGFYQPWGDAKAWADAHGREHPAGSVVMPGYPGELSPNTFEAYEVIYRADGPYLVVGKDGGTRFKVTRDHFQLTWVDRDGKVITQTWVRIE